MSLVMLPINVNVCEMYSLLCNQQTVDNCVQSRSDCSTKVDGIEDRVIIKMFRFSRALTLMPHFIQYL